MNESVRHFQFDFTEIDFTRDELAPLLGFNPGEIPDPFPEMLDHAISHSKNFNGICGGYKVFDSVDVNRQELTIQVETSKFLPGKIVTTQLKKSSKAALFACTAGPKISEHSETLQNNGDTLEAFIFDVIGSVVVEKAMDKIQNVLQKEVEHEGLGISDRYSPGYCNWDVKEQHQLFALLPDTFCGITLSPSALMSPIKSVSGIIGIGSGLKPKGYQCEWCSDKTCIYRKIKKKA